MKEKKEEKGKTMSNILLCVSGGIAAYKAIDLASRLSQGGHTVKTILSANAQRFVSQLSFAAITAQSTHSDMFTDPDPIAHIHLADWADLVVIAPATANIMAKAACGIADDLISTTLLAHTKPKLWVPAMNVNMYNSPATQANLHTLKDRGDYILEPVSGHLACGYSGKGKYPPNEEVVAAINCYLHYGRNLEGIRVLVTAGATEEPIDAMRKITNNSSGKMGLSLCRALALRGAKVSLIHGSMKYPIPYYLDEIVSAPTVQEMHTEVTKRQNDQDWIIKCAAVSDYRPAQAFEGKLKKSSEVLNLELEPTQDILAFLSEHKPAGQKLIGFAAQSDDLIPNAKAKLQKKNLDMICANYLSTSGKVDTAITIIKAIDQENPIQLDGPKELVAHKIIDQIKEL